MPIYLTDSFGPNGTIDATGGSYSCSMVGSAASSPDINGSINRAMGSFTANFQDGARYPLTAVSRQSNTNFGQDDAASAADRAAIGSLDACLLSGMDSGGRMDPPVASGYIPRTQCSQEILAGNAGSAHHLFTYHNMMEIPVLSGNRFEREAYLQAANGPGASDGYAYDSAGVVKQFFVNQDGVNNTNEVAVDGNGYRFPEWYADHEVQPKYIDPHIVAGVKIGGANGINVMLDNFQVHANRANVSWPFDGVNYDSRMFYDLDDPRHTSANVVINSINLSGTTATVVTATPHYISTDPDAKIIISGATPSGYNGTFTVGDPKDIVVTNSTTFTYQVASGLSTPAGGSATISLADKYGNLVEISATYYSQWRANYQLGRKRIIENNPGMVILTNTNQWADDRDPNVPSTWAGAVSGLPGVIREYQLGGDSTKADVNGGFSESNVHDNFPRAGVTRAGVNSGQVGSWQRSYNSAYIGTSTARDPNIFFMSAGIECLQAGIVGAAGLAVYPSEPAATTPWNLVRWWFTTTQIVGAHCVFSGVIAGTTAGRAKSVPIFDEYGLSNTVTTKLSRKFMGLRVSDPPTSAWDTHANGELWIAEFSNALCIVNTDNNEANPAATVTVASLPGGATEWMRFNGSQDGSVNDGTSASSNFTIAAIDGIVLVRKSWYNIAPTLIKNISTASGRSVTDIFHPGHWFLQSGANALPSSFLTNDKFIGVKLVHRWNWIENLTVGDGDHTNPAYDWTDTDARVAECVAAGKYYTFIIQHGKFGGDPPNTPTYMWTDSSYGGDSTYYGNIDRQPNVDGWREYIENTKVKDQVKLLTTAIVGRYGSDPFFEFYGESESSLEGAETGQRAAQIEIWEHSRDLMNALGKYNVVNINFVNPEWTGANQTEKTEDAANWVVDNGMGLGAPDLKQGNGVLDGGIFKVARLRNTEVPISVDVQWEDYNPNQNTTMNVRELLAFGNGEVFGSVSSADAALSPKNWIHTWENRSPWYAGSPTDPKSGDNVLEVIAVEEVTNAEAFYESIGQGQYP